MTPADGAASRTPPSAPQRPSRLRTDSIRLTSLRRELGLHSRRLIDTGVLTPATRPPATAGLSGHDERPTRPIVRILLVNYLGESTIETIRCTAQTTQRGRCTRSLTAQTPGRWVLLPTQPICSQLAPPSTSMAAYDLSHLPYTEQRRWRTQHCTAHAASATAADLTPATWKPFDPLLHARYIRTELPTPGRHRPRPR